MELAVRIEAWVRGPQAGDRLANGAEGRFHSTRSDRVVIGGKRSGAITVGKHLEVGDGVGHLGECGVNGVFGTEVSPEKPGSGSGFGTGRNDAGMERLHSSAIVKAESISGRKWPMVQGSACG